MSTSSSNAFEKSKLNRGHCTSKAVLSSFWSEKNVLKLITAIREQPILWQTDHKGQKIQALRDKAWLNVMKQFSNEISLHSLLTKWKTLRNQYCRSKYNRKFNPEKHPWKFYADMTFIDHKKKDKQSLEHLHNGGDLTFWTDETMLKLIEAVKTRKLLWDSKDKQHLNRYHRKQAWKSIRREFENEVPIRNLVEKWQDLENVERSLRNKEVGATESANWKFFEHLNFLRTEDEAKHEENKKGEEVPHIKMEPPMDDFMLFNETSNDISCYEDEEDAEDNVHDKETQYISMAPPIDDLEFLLSNETSNDISCHSINDVKLEANAESTISNVEADSVENFTKYFATELRKIKNFAYRETTQRKILQFLWQCMDEEPEV